MSCDDPNCPGCMTECYVNAMKAIGCDAEIIFHAVMENLRNNPEGGFEVTITTIEEGTVH
jgi:hypothetical protein